MTKQPVREEKVDIRSKVRERYGAIAQRSLAENSPDCGCSSSQTSCCSSKDEATQLDTVAHLYQDPDVADLPEEVTDISLGCGDPVTLAALQPGQNVLDLGSGGGIDCFLAAKKVGPAGKVIGVDMTAAMIEKARLNQQKVGAENVEFRLGEIEHLPAADNSVDVIISNCVINLSPDKPQVFREALRVLKPGGKLAVSDIVTDGPLPEVIKNSLSAWAGCVAGALDVKDYTSAMEAAGFVDVTVKPTYWDKEFFDEAVEQLEPQVREQVKAAKAQGKKVVIVGDGVDGEVLTLEDEAGFEDFDPRKAIFSARITAFKPK